MTDTAEARVARAFNDLFANWDIRLTAGDVFLGAHRRIGERGWLITYRVDPDDAGRPSLELYATHRMTNDRHVRIWSDGHVEHLDAIWELYVSDPKVPGSREWAEQEFMRHNREVADRLRARGLYPEGDINAYLRTGGEVAEDPADG